MGSLIRASVRCDDFAPSGGTARRDQQPGASLIRKQELLESGVDGSLAPAAIVAQRGLIAAPGRYRWTVAMRASRNLLNRTFASWSIHVRMMNLPQPDCHR